MSSTKIGEPTITEGVGGILVTLEEFEDALYTLASACGEDDWDGIAKLVKRAKHDLTQGIQNAPTLLAAFASKAATDGYIAGRNEANELLRCSGYIYRLFQHNLRGGRMESPFFNLSISAYAVRDTEDLYLLFIADRRRDSRTNWMSVIANVLGVEREFMSISLRFPLERIKGDYFCLDYAPFMETMNELGLILHPTLSHILTLDGVAAAEWAMQWAANRQGPPSITMEIPEHRGWEVELTPYGCKLNTYRPGSTPRFTVECERQGSVITGPIKTRHNSEKLQKPVVMVKIGCPNVVWGEYPHGPILVTNPQKEPFRAMARAIAHGLQQQR